MKIHSLYFYPVKSCGAVQVDRLRLEEAGPKWDRQWMIVDENGKFVTQRERSYEWGWRFFNTPDLPKQFL